MDTVGEQMDTARKQMDTQMDTVLKILQQMSGRPDQEETGSSEGKPEDKSAHFLQATEMFCGGFTHGTLFKSQRQVGTTLFRIT